MTYGILWIIIAIVCVIIEAATLGLTTIWFAAGAILAWISAELGLHIMGQVLIFLISSSVLLYFTRPIASKYLKIGHTRTNADTLIGKVGLVTEKIDSINSTGQVKISGQVWSAKSKEIIEVGEKVEVLEIQGVKLVVNKLN